MIEHRFAATGFEPNVLPIASFGFFCGRGEDDGFFGAAFGFERPFDDEHADGEFDTRFGFDRHA